MGVGELNEELVADLRARVAARAAEWRDGARLTGLRPMSGGASSLTFLGEFEGLPAEEAHVVVKVAPPGLEPVRNRDVLRQARLQRALQGRAARRLAPETLFEDAGAPIEVPPMMAMGMVPGECVEPVLAPLADRPGASIVRERYLDAASLLADLHALRPEEIGLGGEPVVTLEDEIDRWTRAFGTVSDELRGGYLRADAALRATMPAALPPVVNHGDYRLGNTLCVGARVEAIIDWEIWSVGDPRVDITWFTYFTDDAEHPAAEPNSSAGTPTAAEVVAAYEAAAGRALPDLDWFHALTRYKEAAATALLLKRAMKAGKQMVGHHDQMLPALPRLVQEAIDIVSA
jgi:aminoglycoside phosphotransferase (APT) family kinase protein